jgi:uncharacterized RDD family membrane protein YckC
MNAIAPAQATSLTGPSLDNKRVAAALIDLAVLFGFGFVLGLLGGGRTPGITLVLLAWALYYYFALEMMTGQTLGKRAMGIKVVRSDGSPADMRAIGIRTVLRLIDGFAFYLVGLVVMLATKDRRQRLGDLAGDTVVTTADAQPPKVAPAAMPPPAPAPPAPEPSLSAPEAPVTRPAEPITGPAAAAPAPTPKPKAQPPSPPQAQPPPAAPPPRPAAPAPPPPAAAPPPARPKAPVRPAPPTPPAAPPPARPQAPPAPPPRPEEPIVREPAGDGDSPPAIKIVSPIDLVMGEDEEPQPSRPTPPAGDGAA